MLSNLYRATGKILSPSGERAKLSILIYHRVLNVEDPLFPNEVTANSFDLQLAQLSKIFNVLPLGEAIKRLRTNSLPSCAACITFDDGYADNFNIALPILKKHNLHATFFIATAYLDGGRMFNDSIIHAIRTARLNYIDLTNYGIGVFSIETISEKTQAINTILSFVKYLPLIERERFSDMLIDTLAAEEPSNDLMMSTDQLKRLRKSDMEIGGHTVHHPILAKLNPKEAMREIADGRDFLEEVIGEKIRFFAYPNGKKNIDYHLEQATIIRQLGFQAAFSTEWGVAGNKSDLYQLPRFTPYTKIVSRFVPMLFQNIMRKQ